MKLDRIPNSSPAAHSFGSFCSFMYSCASSDPGVPKTVRARSDQELLTPRGGTSYGVYYMARHYGAKKTCSRR